MSTKDTELESPPPLTGGPFGHGDPNDKRLRKTEKDIIIRKMMKEEATKRCSEAWEMVLKCAKDAGLLLTYKCKAEINENNMCLDRWLKNPEFLNEMTNIYLERRTHYRQTGEPLMKYDRLKKQMV